MANERKVDDAQLVIELINRRGEAWVARMLAQACAIAREAEAEGSYGDRCWSTAEAKLLRAATEIDNANANHGDPPR